MSLLVVGSLALDTIETPFGKAERTLGGSATFISVAASYFIQPVRLVGVVGGDFPKKELEYFEEREIDLEGLQIKEEGKTFHWHGKYDYDLNTRESLVTELNVFADFDPVVPDNFKKSTYLCLGNIHPSLQKKVYEQMQNPKLVVADTMNFWIDGAYNELLEVLKHINVFIINDSEAREISKEANLFKAAKKIQALGPKIVIIKKGEHGALLFYEDELFSAPAYHGVRSSYLTLAFITMFVLVEWIGREGQYALENLGRSWPRIGRWALYLSLIFVLGMFMRSEETPFIYFQF